MQLTGPRAFHDRFDNALDLLRTARHDPATMVHALALGQSQVEHDRGENVTRAAAEILEAAIEFLGVKPRTGDLIATRGR